MKREQIDTAASALNKESGLSVQVLYDEPGCFDSLMAHCGNFINVTNYIALVGPKEPELDETAGFFGEQLVLRVQELDLNTCWVALSHGRSSAAIGQGQKLACIIALGYGATQGTPHRNKPLSDLFNCASAMPDWFARGMEAALLAPTALNQQEFCFELQSDKVTMGTGRGSYTKLDRGIVKYHFDTASVRTAL